MNWPEETLTPLLSWVLLPDLALPSTRARFSRSGPESRVTCKVFGDRVGGPDQNSRTETADLCKVYLECLVRATCLTDIDKWCNPRVDSQSTGNSFR